MKKIWLVVAAIAVISCKDEAPVDYAIISGTITNSDATELTIQSADRSFNDKTVLAEDGTFLDTLRVDEGAFYLSDGQNYAQVYITTGSNIAISYDAADFDNTLSFSGEGSEISTYLQSKGAKTSELMGEGTSFYELEEESYKAKAKEIATASAALLEIEGMDKTYKANEEKNLHYEYLSMLSRYEMYHSHYAKKPDFKVSEGFLAEMDAVDYTSEEDYNNSRAYSQLVSSYYRTKGNEIAEAEGIANDVAFIKAVGACTSDTMKNGLLAQSASHGVTYTEDLEGFYAAFMEVSTDEEMRKSITETYNKLQTIAKGQPSPNFEGYENYAGGTTSLADLKGKFVYVDVWATWCGPCKAEIPFLQKVEKEYHDKNIEFVSISVDQEKDHEAWKTMVAEKELGGIQLFADKSWDSDFVQGYLIKGIPRFILIDPEGNIVSSNAPRPSSEKLIEMFDANNI